jgi:uncharacterized membrane protein YphA (DoxX/SURF4 family)
MNLQKYSAPTLRIGIALIILWFGFSQIISPQYWYSFLPEWTANAAIEQSTFIYINGTFEIIFSLLLIMGLYTRAVSLLLSVHMLSIALSIPYGPTMIRDLGISIAVISVFLRGADEYTFDKKMINGSSYSPNTTN